MASFIEENYKEWVKDDNYLVRGSFGLIELWKNKKTGETIAIKKCRRDIQQLSVRQRERWTHEVNIMEILNHPNIVKTRDIPQIIFDETLDLPVLCMEYCKKGNLRQLLKKGENYCGVNERLLLTIMADVSSAIEYLHKNKIIHRDIKPENIVTQELQNGKLVFKLIDLGYAKIIEETSIDDSIVGSINYIAPEIILNMKYNFTVDYWSMGILFYELLTGVRPFLPNIPLNKKWINSIRVKDDDDIAAREIGEEIIFFKTIEDPTNISECLRDNMVPWFRLVLQWDPKKRGNNHDNFRVFKMLREIMEKKIVRVFYVIQYKTDSFEVDKDVSLMGLKRIIFEREKINVDQQIITTSSGEILENENSLIFEQLEDLSVIVYETDKLIIERIPELKLPKSVHIISEKPRILLDYFTFKKYYHDCTFLMNYQIELCRSYGLSLGSKIDLSEARFSILQSKIEDMLLKVKNLDNQIKLIYKNKSNVLLSKTSNPEFINKLKKIQTLIIGSSNLKKKIIHLENNKDELKSNFLKTITIDELTSDYEKSMGLIEKCKSLDPNREYQPVKMVKLLSDFLKTRNNILENQKLNDTCRQILEFEKMLTKLEKSLTSFNELLPLYQEEIDFFLNINQENFACTKSNKIPGVSMIDKNRVNIVEAKDSVIYDNIMLGHMIDSLMDGINKMKKEAESMDTDT